MATDLRSVAVQPGKAHSLTNKDFFEQKIRPILAEKCYACHPPRRSRPKPPHPRHQPHAGAGIKPGLTYGATDDFGYYSIEKKVHVHDLHATIHHLLGIQFSGRDMRLTDVHGNIVHDILV